MASAVAGGFLLRSDFRVGDCNGGAAALLEGPGVGLALDDGAVVEAARELGLLLVLEVPLVWVPFATPARKLFLTGVGSGGGASRLTRDDFLMPFSIMVVGPSAANDFQGGDTARDRERRGVKSSSFRRFTGRDGCIPSSPFSGSVWSSSFISDGESSSSSWTSWVAVGVSSWWACSVCCGGSEAIRNARLPASLTIGHSQGTTARPTEST